MKVDLHPTALMAVPGISIGWDRVLSVSSDVHQDG
jgi:hypothetical protein